MDGNAWRKWSIDINRRLAATERRLHITPCPEAEDVILTAAGMALAEARAELEPVAKALDSLSRRLSTAAQRTLDVIAMQEKELRRIEARLDALADALDRPAGTATPPH